MRGEQQGICLYFWAFWNYSLHCDFRPKGDPNTTRRKTRQPETREKGDPYFSKRPPRIPKCAKHLLAHAKRAVEIAIEQDEQTAIDWLESVSQLP